MYTNIKTFEDACKAINADPAIALGGITNKNDIAGLKLAIIAQALNDGWKPDWNNTDAYKYYPLFYYNTDTKRFSCHDSYCWYRYSSVGSRLCFKSAEIAEYAGTQFIGIYNDYLIPQD